MNSIFRKSLSLSVFVFSFFIGGCSTMAPGTQVKNIEERNGVNLELIPAAYREVYFSPSESDERHCRAPDPDFTVQQSDQLSASSPAGDGVSLGAGENQTGINLGGRTQTVLITRELMYRACELTANINADAETTIAIYTSFLRSVSEISTNSSDSNDASTVPDWPQDVEDETDDEVVSSESDDFDDAN